MIKLNDNEQQENQLEPLISNILPLNSLKSNRKRHKSFSI